MWVAERCCMEPMGAAIIAIVVHGDFPSVWDSAGQIVGYRSRLRSVCTMSYASERDFKG